LSIGFGSRVGFSYNRVTIIWYVGFQEIIVILYLISSPRNENQFSGPRQVSFVGTSKFLIFSSPCQGQCELLPSLGVRLYREPSKDASYHQVLIHLATRFQRRRFFRNQPIRNKNDLWRPRLLMDRDLLIEIGTLIVQLFCTLSAVLTMRTSFPAQDK
jgi:hypothetical protein